VAHRSRIDLVRLGVVASVGVLLAGAVWFQRATIGDAVGEMRGLSSAVVAALVALAVLDRISRADIVRRLLGTGSFFRSLTIHDVGTAASKGVPLGGPLATGLRWSIARDASVPTTTFTSMLVAYGVATTFVTWLLPFAVLLVDIARRSPTLTDAAMLAVCAAVVGGSALFWAVVLRSERITAWMVGVLDSFVGRAAERWPTIADRLDGHDFGADLLDVRSSLRAVAARPGGLLVRTALAQSVGAVILLVALRGLGVGDELGLIEFARVYFVVTLLSSFVPVPGGVGVVEAGLTGALVAAGVDAPSALAGVLVYRLLTYVVPIALGAVLYAVWRLDVARRGVDERSGTQRWPPIELHEPAIIE
jgi:putative heme transporter